MTFFTPPVPIVNPTPLMGLAVRRPRMQVYVDGTLIPGILSVTTTRGLDQDIAVADVVMPYPLPGIVAHYSHIQILVGVDDPDPTAPYTGMRERFVGYVITFSHAFWPGAITVHCEDALSMAKYYYHPDEMDLSGETDRSAVYRILTEGVGYSGGLLDIGGNDTHLTDIDAAKMFWEQGQTALEAIQQVDEVSLGFRTWATIGGRIERTLIRTTPNLENAVHWFGEGVDIIEGSQASEVKDAKDEITVSGFDGLDAALAEFNRLTAQLDTETAALNQLLLDAVTDHSQALADRIKAQTARVAQIQALIDALPDPYDWHKNSYWIRFYWLVSEAHGLGITSPMDVARYILAQLDKAILKVTISTHIDYPFQGTEVVGITSQHLEVDQKFWIQSVQLTVEESGAFTQTLQCVSELAPPNRQIITPPTTPLPGRPVVTPTTLTVAPIAPTAADVLPKAAVIAIDAEFGAPAGEPANRGQKIYAATASSQSTSQQGVIVKTEWQAHGQSFDPATMGAPQKARCEQWYADDLALADAAGVPPAAYPIGCEAYLTSLHGASPPGGSAIDPLIATTAQRDAAAAWHAADLAAVDAGAAPMPYPAQYALILTRLYGRRATPEHTGAGVGVPGTQIGDTFTSYFTSLTPPPTISLTVTDSNGAIGSTSVPVAAAAAPVRSRVLFACTATDILAFNGSVWRSATPGGPVQVVGTGPYWGAGSNLIHSLDFLVSGITPSVAFASGEQIISIWVHETKKGYVAVGGDGGNVAYTHDDGATWAVRPGPGGPVTHVIQTLGNSNEIHVTTPSGWHKSEDEGATWDSVKAGNFVYLELAPARNITVGADGVLRKGENGQPFSGPTVPIVAATAHIRKDTFYGLGADGTTWIQEAPGDFALVPGAPVPDGPSLPAIGGCYRDGQMVDLVYFATSTGVYKTVDGFRTADGYVRLLKEGLLTP